MSYKVIVDHFVDVDGTPYYKGDVYPFNNQDVSNEHLDYLSSDKNKLGKPLIENKDSEVANKTEKVEEVEPVNDEVADEVEVKEDDKPKRTKRATRTSKAKTGDK